MYALNTSKGSSKLLLKSGWQDYGTSNNPTFIISDVLKAPPESYGLIGLEKMLWKQPYYLPADFCKVTGACSTVNINPASNTTYSNTYTSSTFSSNASLAGVSYLSSSYC